MNIVYHDDAEISVEMAIDLYRKTSLGERRPVDSPDIFEGMFKNASLTISAWDGKRLVGIARSLTDFVYIAYLADLAVDADYQRRGIGRRLVQETGKRLGRGCMIVLFSAPRAHEYYPKLGFESNPFGWVLRGS